MPWGITSRSNATLRISALLLVIEFRAPVPTRAEVSALSNGRFEDWRGFYGNGGSVPGTLDRMPYVVKAVSTSGIVTWLARPGAEGSRSIAPRSRADVLPTLEDAKGAIAKMPQVFADAGIKFSVVDTDAEG